MHRFAFSIAQRDAANLFLACEWIFNRQLRVEAITPAPKPAHGLLASVDHFCKSGAMRLSIREFAFGLACDGFGMHTVNLAQLLAQTQLDDFAVFVSNC